ncbi:membrane-associated protein, putative [Bodo saltans]|uniref:Membrane-associated protein, putative n=1 Tax=Bodo saltans TaxID=75058 RepID=A0A0S4IQJ5_BODSA|nr:membrane-associated protein, putative [Bodo saltans]|eukprot:CUF96396.1 membrane-associated protein, putative [Bodo saltans]
MLRWPLLMLALLVSSIVVHVESNGNSTSWSPVCRNDSSVSSGTSKLLAACPALSETLIIPNVTVVFGNGKSYRHTFVINVCSHTSASPSMKSRLVTSGPNINCSSGYVTQFGQPESWSSCESIYHDVLEPCVWSLQSAGDGHTPFIACMFGEPSIPTQQQQQIQYYSKLEVVLLCSQEVSASGNVTAFLDEADASAPPRIVLTGSSPAVCSCGSQVPSHLASSGAVLADALIGSIVALMVVMLTYSIGHNYFVKGLRGWRVLPWAAHFTRTSRTYDHLGDGSEDDEGAPRDTSLQRPVE